MTWSAWYPPDYPIRDEPHHNPWVVIDPISGMTAYRLWQENRHLSDQEFRKLLREFKGQVEEEWNSPLQYAEKSEPTSWNFFQTKDASRT